jgi:hypothetical protein
MKLQRQDELLPASVVFGPLFPFHSKTSRIKTISIMTAKKSAQAHVTQNCTGSLLRFQRVVFMPIIPVFSECRSNHAEKRTHTSITV